MVRWSRAAAVLTLGVAVAGCEVAKPVTPVPRPPARPENLQPAPPPKPEAPPEVRSSDSLVLEKYYARVEKGLLSQGLLRKDGGGRDTPYGRRQLVENFLKIALYDEYARVGGGLVARTTPSVLRRWETPVRMQVDFGETVPNRIRSADRAAITAYAARLSRVTGLPISEVGRGGNFHVFVMNEDERRALAPVLRTRLPGLSEADVRTITELPQRDYCVVFARAGSDGAYSSAVAFIRAENPDLLRLSCIHEELAQGLGLPNDSPSARPSIFNDDEEFALLTTQDELMLKMLYDPRMRVGMSEEEARPVAEEIAAELLGGDS
ncbi:DUF2927 domain-containing protein [Oceaniglobus roseus]|uniref:DUF2927 domain-containing protein n=1 Tax=Oceaniglobus roseus TaxID=1737570 RepID=UPI000C7EB370|nr:DUF2927 domain-containing protein [Kandeliimicrobium roseum]